MMFKLLVPYKLLTPLPLRSNVFARGAPGALRLLHQSPLRSSPGPKTTISSKTNVAGPDTGTRAGNAILRRIPRFLRPFATRFINAPVSHVTSFLVLHELTALVPLIGLWYVFHHYHTSIPHWDFTSYGIDKVTSIIDKSMAQFDFSDYSVHEKAQFIMEGAYAYMVVKTLMPVRIMISLSLMPGFSRWVVVPVHNLLARMLKKTPKRAESPPLATNELKTKKVDKPRL